MLQNNNKISANASKGSAHFVNGNVTNNIIIALAQRNFKNKTIILAMQSGLIFEVVLIWKSNNT